MAKVMNKYNGNKDKYTMNDGELTIILDSILDKDVTVITTNKKIHLGW